MLDNWDTQSVGADVVAMDEDGNPLVDEYGNPIDASDTIRVEVCGLTNLLHFQTYYPI